jgi:hypothetical protein
MAKKVILPPSAPASVLTSDSSPEGARIPSPELTPWQQVVESLRPPQFRCSIRDNPTLVLPAANVDEARLKYLLILGITSTENTVNVVALS